MSANRQSDIAGRALAAVGTPFALFGRTTGKALDCVGLALVALGPEFAADLSHLRYSLRGDHLAKARRTMAGSTLAEIEPAAAGNNGDLLLVSPGPSQLHFMVCVPDGWVHADAGLGRVVLRPGPLAWTVKCAWRLNPNSHGD